MNDATDNTTDMEKCLLVKELRGSTFKSYINREKRNTLANLIVSLIRLRKDLELADVEIEERENQIRRLRVTLRDVNQMVQDLVVGEVGFFLKN
mmetsp:Transcript_402/g.478  ORF Transcript_402/g.478 Transcript_402/m.478 type:complete len:94 (-) Transcript_402:26-307(-)